MGPLVVAAFLTGAVTVDLVSAIAQTVPAPTERPGPVLQIPGLPAIPLPPGARVFGPSGPESGSGPRATDSQAAPPPKSSARASDPPKAAETRPESKSEPKPDGGVQAGRQRILEDLFTRLERTQDADEARGISGAIERVWMRSGSDTADLLMERVSTAISKKEWPLAEELLDKMIEIEPQWAEVWNKRATVRFFNEDLSGSMADLAYVLKLEPRHYTALVGMGVILQRRDFDAQALRVFRRALEINPQLDDIRKRVEKLQLEVEGRDI
jgi:tetratricopeptide (TPR) repeat protein